MLHSTLTKVAVTAAGTALAAATAVTPAVATQSAPVYGGAGPVYKGQVIAKTGLKVRSGPSTNYKVVGFLKYKEIVKISCKVNGQNVDGNPRWYRLADGSYAFASARYIANVGPAPKFCSY